jgi:hypothetical protein
MPGRGRVSDTPTHRAGHDQSAETAEQRGHDHHSYANHQDLSNRRSQRRRPSARDSPYLFPLLARSLIPRRFDCLLPRLPRLLIVPRLRCPPAPAAAPPPAHTHPPGLTTRFTWHVEEGVRRDAPDPLPPKPRREAKETPEAGRRPVALKEGTHRAKQMGGNTWRETGRDADWRPVRAALPCGREPRRARPPLPDRRAS